MTWSKPHGGPESALGTAEFGLSGPQVVWTGRNLSLSRDIESAMQRFLILAALTALPVVAGAQNSRTAEEKTSSTVPVNMMPPAGKCRIWMVGVAPAQQPAPTDCQTALRQRTPNGVVIFGPVEREEASSAFRGRPNVEQGPEDRPRNSTAREPSREPNREPARDPVAAPARERAETRAPAERTPSEPRRPAAEPRRESPARPPSGTARPTQDPPTRKPPTDAVVAGRAPVMSAERAS